DPEEHEWAIDNLEAAVALAPESGRLHVALAKAHLEVWREQTSRVEENGEAGVSAQGVLALAPPGPLFSPAHVALGAAAPGLAGGEFRQEFLAREGQPLARRHLEPALGHLLQARDACPLLADAHLQIGINVDQFRQAEPRRAYLERAKRLAPDDPEQWY